MNWSELWSGKPESYNKFELGYTPDQMQQTSQYGSQAMGMINDPYKGFAPIAAQANQNFQQNTIPSLMNRLTSLGGGGSSGSFGLAAAQAGRDMNTDLAAQQARFGQQQQGLGMNLAQLGQNRMYGNQYKQEQPGLPESILRGLLGNFASNMPQTLSGAESYFSGKSSDIQKANQDALAKDPNAAQQSTGMYDKMKMLMSIASMFA